MIFDLNSDQFFMIRRDPRGNPIELIPLDVTNWQVERHFETTDVTFVLEGVLDTRKGRRPPAGWTAEQEPMPTGEAFLERYSTPELMSGPD